MPAKLFSTLQQPTSLPTNSSSDGKIQYLINTPHTKATPPTPILVTNGKALYLGNCLTVWGQNIKLIISTT